MSVWQGSLRLSVVCSRTMPNAGREILFKGPSMDAFKQFMPLAAACIVVVLMLAGLVIQGDKP